MNRNYLLFILLCLCLCLCLCFIFYLKRNTEHYFSSDKQGHLFLGPVGAIAMMNKRCGLKFNKKTGNCWKGELKKATSVITRLSQCRISTDKLKALGNLILKLLGINALMKLPDFPNAAKLFYTAIRTIKEKIVFIVTKVRTLPGEIIDTVMGIISDAKELILNFPRKIIKQLKESLNKLEALPNKLLTRIEANIKKVKDRIQIFINKIQKIIKTVKGFLVQIKKFPKMVIAAIFKFLKNPFGNIFKKYGKMFLIFFIILIGMAIIPIIYSAKQVSTKL